MNIPLCCVVEAIPPGITKEFVVTAAPLSALLLAREGWGGSTGEAEDVR